MEDDVGSELRRLNVLSCSDDVDNIAAAANDLNRVRIEDSYFERLESLWVLRRVDERLTR